MATITVFTLERSCTCGYYYSFHFGKVTYAWLLLQFSLWKDHVPAQTGKSGSLTLRSLATKLKPTTLPFSSPSSTIYTGIYHQHLRIQAESFLHGTSDQQQNLQFFTLFVNLHGDHGLWIRIACSRHKMITVYMSKCEEIHVCMMALSKENK